MLHVNTQIYNKQQYIVKRKMKNNGYDFETQLENRLQQIDYRRSHKKIKQLKSIINPTAADLQMYSIIDENNDENISKRTPEKSSQQSKFASNIILQNNIPDKSTIKDKQRQSCEFLFQIIENKEVKQFVKKHFPDYTSAVSSISIDKFIEKTLIQYTKQNEILDEETIKEYFISIQNQITTNQPQYISVNALEATLKRNKTHLKIYIKEKLLKSKYEAMVHRQTKKYKQKKKQLYDRQENITQMEYNVKQVMEECKKKERQLLRKQQQINKKQKQLPNRLKNYRQMLDSKMEKLLSEGKDQLSKVAENIEKKINSFERNCRYKVQHLEKNINEIHRLRQYDEAKMKKTMTQDLQNQFKKNQKSNVARLEKQLKQREQNIIQLQSQKCEYEEQCNKLMKACSNLQIKISKLQKKIRHLSTQLEQSNKKMLQQSYLVKEKQYQIQQLTKILTQYHKKDEYEQVKEEKQKKKNLKSSRKTSRSITSKNINKKAVQHKTLQIILTYQLVLDLLMQIMTKNTRVLPVCNYQNFAHKISQDSISDILTTITEVAALNNPSDDYFIGQMLINCCTFILNTHLVCLKNVQNNLILTKFQGVRQYFSKITLKTEEFNLSKTLIFKNVKHIDSQWRICILMVLTTNYSKQQELGTFWLNTLSEIIQRDESIREKILQSLHISNYLLGIIQKISFCILNTSQFQIEINKIQNSQTLNLLDALIDFLLNLQVTSCQSLIKYIYDLELYRRIIQYFFILAGKFKASDSKYYSAGLQIMEKISIILQRIVLNYGKSIKYTQEQILKISQFVDQERISQNQNQNILILNMKSILDILSDDSQV